MSVTEQTPIVSHTGNGATTLFAFAFLVLASGDLTVQVTDASGVTTTKTLGVDYTISGIGSPSGGSVTFFVAPVNGTTVVIFRDSALERATDYQDNGDLLADTVNRDFDRTWLVLQEIFGGGKGVVNALRVPNGETIATLGNAAARANRILAFDGAGAPLLIVGVDPSSAAALATDLADSTNVAKGDALIAIKRSAVTSAPATTLHVWYEGQPFHVREFGALGDGATDDTAALQACAAAIKLAGRGCMIFAPGKTYNVWPSGSGSTLFDLTNCTGVVIEGNGATLSAGNVNATNPIVFELSGVQGFACRNLNYTQSYQTLDSVNGATLFNMQLGGSRFLYENITMTGGLRGIHCLGAVGVGGAAVEQVSAFDCTFTSVYYPQQFRLSGNHYFARGIRTLNCGRGYFPFNVHDHDVQMFSQHGGPFDDCLLKNYTYAAEYNRLENIKLDYYSDKRHASASTQGADQALIALEFQLVDTVAGNISNIDIRVNVEATATKPATKLLNMRKFTAASAVDTTARGHKLDNLRISGHVRNWQNAGNTCLDLFTTAEGYVWTGDVARNIDISNLSIEQSSGANKSIVINGQAWSANAGISLRNVYAQGSIERANWDASYPFVADNVQSSTLVALSGWQAYTPTWTASGTAPSLGNGTLTGRWRRSGDRVIINIELVAGSTTTYGTGFYSFSLPAGVASSNTGRTSWGSGLAVDVSSGTRYVLASEVLANATVVRASTDAATLLVGQVTPFTWASGDALVLQNEFHAAP